MSPDALDVARRNVDDYGLAERLELHQSNLFDALPARRYDVILCNPPYVNNGSMDALPQEYLHEPQLAWLAARTAWTWCAASWKPRAI